MAELRHTTIVFTDADRGGATWHRIKSLVDRRIEVLRRINDNDANDVDTAKVRGRIAELKRLLNEVEPTQPSPEESR